MLFPVLILLSILAGQLIKIPLITNGGATILDLSVLVLCTFGLFKLKFQFKSPPLFIKFGLIFASIATLSLILTPLPLNLSEKIISFFYTVRFASYLLLGWLIYSSIFPDIRKNIEKVLIYSGFILSLIGLLQFIFVPDLGFLSAEGWDPHVLRTVATFLDPNFMGAYFALTLLLITHANIFRNNLNLKKLLFIIIFIALFTTFSRGAYLVFFVSLTVLSILKRSTHLGILTILLSFSLAVGYFSYNRQIAEPRHIDRTESASYRLGTWQQGLTIFQRNPILGVGFNTYRKALQQYNLGSEQFILSHGASSNDSSLLYVAATTGIIGLISYLFFLLAMITQRKNPVLQAGLLGLLAQSFFANTLFYPFLFIWLILVAVKENN
ncbi:MAG: O-antigen ligase family protein [Candidatus Daviesbacteria bacterium]|nr:O-antigen ligase family protein [Candidatus Daviesbacteria bacterium]